MDLDSYEKEILFSTLAFLAKRLSYPSMFTSKSDNMAIKLLGEKCAEIASKYQLERTGKNQ